MRSLFYMLILTVFTFCSCVSTDRNVAHDHQESEDHKVSLTGRWYRFSTENGYSEFEIDSQYVTVFSEKLGKSVLEYKIENDSFKYLKIDYSARIISQNDSVVVLEGKFNKATLIRFNESGQTFESVPDENDTALFNAYQKNFSERANEAWIKSGHRIKM